MIDTNDNPALFEQEEFWDTDCLENPYYRQKVGLIRGMIPTEVATILDVGCGSGTILNSLLADYWVVGCDRSWTALKYLRGRPAQVSADDLPFKDRCFDLVMSHQMLEHLPQGIFRCAVQELARVSRQYLMVSVPYRERIEQQRACCGHCGQIYHVWGHLRTFNHAFDLRRLFPDFQLRLHAFCGRENEYMTRPGLWVRQRLGGTWAEDPMAVCPRCGSRAQYQAGFPRRAIAAVVDRLEQCIPKAKSFFWLTCLFERVPFAADEDLRSR